MSLLGLLGIGGSPGTSAVVKYQVAPTTTINSTLLTTQSCLNDTAAEQVQSQAGTGNIFIDNSQDMTLTAQGDCTIGNLNDISTVIAMTATAAQAASSQDTHFPGLPDRTTTHASFSFDPKFSDKTTIADFQSCLNAMNSAQVQVQVGADNIFDGNSQSAVFNAVSSCVLQNQSVADTSYDLVASANQNADATTTDDIAAFFNDIKEGAEVLFGSLLAILVFIFVIIVVIVAVHAISGRASQPRVAAAQKSRVSSRAV